MGRKRVRDLVDQLHQKEEHKMRDAFDDVPLEDSCQECGEPNADDGPWHDVNCSHYIVFIDQDDPDLPLMEDEDDESLE